MIQLDYIESTNRFAKEHLSEFPLKGITCITAKTQSAGYGRRGTPWVSPPGNLYMTLFFYRPLSERSQAGLFTQMLALACIESVKVPLKIKWPNDLFYEGKKCGGILAETIELEGRLAVILGIGLNVNTPVPNVDQPAISLIEITGKTSDLDALAQTITTNFERLSELKFEQIGLRVQALLIKGTTNDNES